MVSASGNKNRRQKREDKKKKIEEEKSLQIELEKYTVLNSWKPGVYVEGTTNKLTSTGFEVLIEEPTKERIYAVLNKLSKKDRTMKINIFSTRDAFEDLSNDLHSSDNVNSGYITSFTKSPNNPNGTITWMQETGKFKDLYGNKEDLLK